MQKLRKSLTKLHTNLLCAWPRYWYFGFLNDALSLTMAKSIPTVVLIFGYFIFCLVLVYNKCMMYIGKVLECFVLCVIQIMAFFQSYQILMILRSRSLNCWSWNFCLIVRLFRMCLDQELSRSTYEWNQGIGLKESNLCFYSDLQQARF